MSTVSSRCEREIRPSGVWDIPRLKGTAARADGLVIKFERANAVEDIMTKARGPRIGLMAWHECAMPRAGSASTRAESVFVDGGRCVFSWASW